jgi:nucleotide-binding universal stress UspA family protein
MAGARLVEEAQSKGVKAHFVLNSGILSAFTGQEVLEAARREQARMIAMPSMTGPFTRFVAGSVAQEVFRAGRTLTWLYGPKAIAERERVVA